MTASALSSCVGTVAFNCARIHEGALAARDAGTDTQKHITPSNGASSGLEGVLMLPARGIRAACQDRLLLVRRSDLLEEALQSAVILGRDDGHVQSKRALRVHRAVRFLIRRRVAVSRVRDTARLRQTKHLPLTRNVDAHIVIHL